MANNITIRKAEKIDYKAINLLYHQTYSLYHKNLPEAYHPTPETVLLKGDFLNIIESKHCLMLVAETESKIVGVTFAEIEDYEDSPVASDYHRVEIYELSVLPEYAKQGVGAKLIAGVEEWAKMQGIADLSVLVYNFNKDEIDFYGSNGYKPYSIKMEKKIGKQKE